MAPVMGGINEIHGRGLNLFIISIAYTFFSILGTADRVTMRYSMNKKCGKDDLFIILATVSRWLALDGDHHMGSLGPITFTDMT